MSDPTTLKIPGFEMIEMAGQGGMATVWKARQISLDRIVAIKILSTQHALETADVQRFQAEAQQAAKLKHPAIIQVYDAAVESGVYYFVMEFVAGYTVGEWVRRKGVLSEKDALLVAECVASALDYAWQNARIIHCDIKPDNVMVDADGTVKLADLGLSRTINAMTSKQAEEDVLGTPAYISPEQATGDPNLDCRADIYSLGAMLYHLVTGKLLFEGQPDAKIMEMQVTGTVPDAMDLNPKISRHMCAMIEKMLAKNRENRHKDWAAVLADVARVKKGLPIHNPPAEGLSTVSRSTRRMKVVSSTLSPDESEKKGLSLPIKIGIAAGALAVIGVIILMSVAQRKPTPSVRVPPPTIPGQPVRPAPGASEAEARMLFESARKWVEANPGKYDDAISLYQRVIAQTRGTSFAVMAENEIHRIAELRQAAIDQVLARLADQTAPMIQGERFVQAAEMYEGYAGILASDTDRKRKAIAADLRACQKRLEESTRNKELQIETKMSDLLDGVVSDLTTAGVEPALARVREAATDSDLSRKQDVVQTVRRLLEGALATDARILDGFRSCRGQEVLVQLNDGPKKMTVTDVREGRVLGQQRLDSGGATAILSVSFEVKDLSAKERLLRMGSEEAQPDVALVKGLMALNSKAYPHAKKYFALTHAVLSDRLLACVEAAEKKLAVDEAKTALMPTIRMMGIAVEPSGVDPWLSAVLEKKIPPDVGLRVLESLAAYRARYGTTKFAKDAEPLLDAIEKSCQPAEAVRTPPQPLKAPPLSRKLADMVGNRDAIRDYLLERNPQMSTKEISLEPRNGPEVLRLVIASDGLMDIGAVAAFRELKELDCAGRSPPGCKLSDLSAVRGLPLWSLSVGFANLRDFGDLRGMALKQLRVRNCMVSDLAPLKDMMTLEDLQVPNTEVKDLTPIRALKLRLLNVANTKVFDIRPLAGMPLESLDISNTQVKDLAVIKDMPLKDLNLTKTRIFNFMVLKGLPLVRLNVSDTQFKDLSLLKGMPLKSLFMVNIPLADISLLRGLSLTELSMPGASVKDYSVLSDMPMRVLTLGGSRVEDLGFTKDMPLDYLDISNTKVFDLAPLAGKKIRTLYINGARVRDLRPIAGMPLQHLSCEKLSIGNYEPLRNLPVRSINIDDPEGAVRPILRSMPNLQNVNGVAFNL